jgi:hypothetical protein
MAYFIKLDPTALAVLEILLDRSNIPGYELMKRARIDEPNQLMAAIDVLRREDIVQVSGDVSQPHSLPFASFAVRPSAKEFASILAKQNR